jgi:hypothetical protein
MSNSDFLAVQLWFGAAAIAFLAIAMTAAGWKHKVFIGAMFAVAAILAAIAIFFRQIDNVVPSQLGGMLTALANSKPSWLGLFVLGIGAVFAIARLRGLGTNAPRSIPTSLRLQFNPNSLIPTCLDIHNIANWYSMRHSFIVNELPTKKSQQGRQQEFRCWTIHIVFDRPITLRQVVVDTHGVQLPLLEVKDRSTRHAIILISGDIPAAVMDITCVV